MTPSDIVEHTVIPNSVAVVDVANLRNVVAGCLTKCFRMVPGTAYNASAVVAGDCN